MNLKKEFCIRFVKMLDIGYTSIIAIIFALLFAFFSDKLFGKYNKEEKNKEKEIDPYFYPKLLGKLILVAFYSGMLTYLLRNVVGIIPSPFNGICGFEHTRLKELNTMPVIIFFIFFIYQFDIFSHAREEFKKIF